MDIEIDNALKKRALGYDTYEVTEEYVENDNGEVRMTKRKVVSKNVPPDVTAVKLLVESKVADSIDSMTDEELTIEKNRLLKLIEKELKDESN